MLRTTADRDQGAGDLTGRRRPADTRNDRRADRVRGYEITTYGDRPEADTTQALRLAWSC
jgi:hypothetical protein